VHGEYKVPGGKLVVVDLEVTDGKLAEVRLSGDFFLEPDDALPLIDAALTGLPADADGKVIAAAVQRALPDGAVLLGFSPEAIATAVLRAEHRATTCRDYEWELVHTG
jgi:lipoate-protein ligase A